MTSLASLPPELFACILDDVPSIYLQRTTISLLRIFSYDRIPIWRRYLFYHIHLKYTDSIRMFAKHLQTTPSDADFIKKLSLTVRRDASAIDLVLMIPKLEWLSLYIGMDPEPEHLRRLFRKPMPNLRYLSLRFSPNELKAICNKCDACLENAFHDSILEILASWPSAELPAFSIVQDAPNGSLWLAAPIQPLAFAHLDHLSGLASSPLLARTQALRLRIPGREYSHLLLHMRQRPSLPQITFLDLTSSRLSDSDVSRLLRNLPRLRHLVLDNCSLPEGHRVQHWAAFAHSCMFAHGDLAFEKTMNRLLVARGGVSGELGSREREARILPRTAALRTLSLSLPPYVDAEEERLKLLAAFRRGWGEAVTTFNMTISAVRRSRVEEGTLVLRCPASSEVGDVLRENDYPGLVVVDDEEFARLGEVRDAEDCPAVRLAGPNGPNGRTKGIEHTEGCGHSIGWDIWEDTL